MAEGQGAGGSSSINGLLYIRGQAADYDGWRQMGCEGWSAQDVLPYFRRAEHQERGGDDFHGTGGPLNVSDITEKNEISKALLEAAIEAGIPRNDDIKRRRAGRRHLVPAHRQERPPPLHRRRLSASRHGPPRICASRPRRRPRACCSRTSAPIGVEYIQHGEKKIARVRREVILAAGAVASPQILEVSGIGRGEVLQKAGVPVLHELIGVGENLQDHYMIGCQWRLKPRMRHGQRIVARPAAAERDFEIRFPAQGPADLRRRPCGRVPEVARELAHPDLQFHMMAASMDLEILGKTQALVLEKEPGLTCTPCQWRPESRGSVHIKSPDATVYPSIVPNYLADPADKQAAVAGLDWGRERS